MRSSLSVLCNHPLYSEEEYIPKRGLKSIKKGELLSP